MDAARLCIEPHVFIRYFSESFSPRAGSAILQTGEARDRIPLVTHLPQYGRLLPPQSIESGFIDVRP